MYNKSKQGAVFLAGKYRTKQNVMPEGFAPKRDSLLKGADEATRQPFPQRDASNSKDSRRQKTSDLHSRRVQIKDSHTPSQLTGVSKDGVSQETDLQARIDRAEARVDPALRDAVRLTYKERKNIEELAPTAKILAEMPGNQAVKFATAQQEKANKHVPKIVMRQIVFENADLNPKVLAEQDQMRQLHHEKQVEQELRQQSVLLDQFSAGKQEMTIQVQQNNMQYMSSLQPTMIPIINRNGLEDSTQLNELLIEQPLESMRPHDFVDE